MKLRIEKLSDIDTVENKINEFQEKYGKKPLILSVTYDVHKQIINDYFYGTVNKDRGIQVTTLYGMEIEVKEHVDFIQKWKKRRE